MNLLAFFLFVVAPLTAIGVLIFLVGRDVARQAARWARRAWAGLSFVRGPVSGTTGGPPPPQVRRAAPEEVQAACRELRRATPETRDQAVSQFLALDLTTPQKVQVIDSIFDRHFGAFDSPLGHTLVQLLGRLGPPGAPRLVKMVHGNPRLDGLIREALHGIGPVCIPLLIDGLGGRIQGRWSGSWPATEHALRELIRSFGREALPYLDKAAAHRSETIQRVAQALRRDLSGVGLASPPPGP